MVALLRVYCWCHHVAFNDQKHSTRNAKETILSCCAQFSKASMAFPLDSLSENRIIFPGTQSQEQRRPTQSQEQRTPTDAAY